MKNLVTLAAIAGVVAAGPALAQDAAEASAPEAPATETAAPAVAPITDADLDKFAVAAVAVNEVSANAELTAEEKQTAMVEAVTSSGLAAEQFNAIATRSQGDDETFKQRVAEAFARMTPTPEVAAEDTAEQPGG